MNINFENVEHLVFYDKELQKELPDLFHMFEQWRLGQRVPGLGHMAKHAVLDLLGVLGKYTEVLEKYFGTTIEVTSLSYHIVRNVVVPLDKAEDELCRYADYPYRFVSRDQDNIYISVWR